MFARATLLLSACLCASCGEPPMRVQIPFAADFAGSAIDCETKATVQLSDLRFYVHDVQLIDASGHAQPLALESSPWQQSKLALLDFENGAGACVNGSAETNTSLAGHVAHGNYRGLVFTLGVPFADNHGDPLQAEAPLGDAAMHWHWRGGYKFLRAGFNTVDDGFWVHLGSTGCSGTIRNIDGCKASNRVTVQLQDFVPGRDTVVIDLATLVADGDLEDGDATDCSSGPAEEHCGSAFRALGLDHARGVTRQEQRLFSSRPAP